ncbi:MAG: hypothetical protein ACYDDI_00580 [Candidatus Acidiferrales bacterium]
MQRIKSVDVFSVAKYASIFYLPLGLSYFGVIAFGGTEQVAVPLGFYFAFLHFTFNLRFPTPTTRPGISLLVVFGSAALAITGWITGLVCALVYNIFIFAKRFGGLRIGVELES